MKILVGIKRTIDYQVRVQIKPDGSGVVTDGVKMSINPFDEIAIEEALRLKENGQATEVIVCSIGSGDIASSLRTALAMGADRAIHITTERDDIQPLEASHALLEIIQKENPELVLLGKQAIDDDCNQTGQMLAALWERPQATFVSKLTLNDGKATATREVDAGLETLSVDLPAVITTDLRLNEPRYVKMPDIMKAKKKPLDEVTLESLNLSNMPKLGLGQHQAPPKRSRGVMVDNVDALVSALKDKELLS